MEGTDRSLESTFPNRNYPPNIRLSPHNRRIPVFESPPLEHSNTDFVHAPNVNRRLPEHLDACVLSERG